MNDLQLLAGTDIPFIEAQLIIHQPTIKEISYLGEDKFFIGCEFLKFSKDLLNQEDKNRLVDYSDFDIFMSIVENKNNESSVKENVDNALMVLTLLFPTYQIEFKDNMIYFLKENEPIHTIDNSNFSIFKNILSNMFNIYDDVENSTNYNPSGALAQKIAEKLKKRHREVAEKNGNNGKNLSLFARYVSILAVGEHKDINMLMNYTVYQLMDEFKRFGLKSEYDFNLKARLAGVKDLKDPEDWMQDIHSPKDKKIKN